MGTEAPGCVSGASSIGASVGRQAISNLSCNNSRLLLHFLYGMLRAKVEEAAVWHGDKPRGRCLTVSLLAESARDHEVL